MIHSIKKFTLALCALTATAQAAEKQPNILTILIDDLGWNHHGVAPLALGTNQNFYHTPNLKKLAASGVSFTSAYVQPNCAPTRAVLLTGQYPTRTTNGVYVVGSLNRMSKNQKTKFKGPDQNEDVPAAAITVAEALKKNGYNTAHIGKYHVGGHEGGEATLPTNAGFDINIGGGKAGHQKACFATKSPKGWTFKNTGYGDLDQFAQPYTTEYLKKHNLPDSLNQKPKHLTDALGDALDQTITDLTAKQKPFYLQFHTYAVHGPVRSRPDLKQAAAKRLKGTDHNKRMAEYLGFIEGFDIAIGRAISRLEDPNDDGDKSDSILENTIIMFMSDNGCTHAPSNPLRAKKGTFYEGGIRTPLVVSWKGTVPAGKVSDQLIHATDFYPTYLELAGNQWKPEPAEHPLDGQSFLPNIKSPDTLQKRDPIFYFFPGYLDSRATPLASIIDEIDGKRHKLIYLWETDNWELYNLTDDIGETKNIAEQNPKIVKQLAKKIKAWLNQKHPTWKPQFPINKKTNQPATFPVPK